MAWRRTEHWKQATEEIYTAEKRQKILTRVEKFMDAPVLWAKLLISGSFRMSLDIYRDICCTVSHCEKERRVFLKHTMGCSSSLQRQ